MSAQVNDQVKATGEEFLNAINAVRRVIELVKDRPVFICIPGIPPTWLNRPQLYPLTIECKPQSASRSVACSSEAKNPPLSGDFNSAAASQLAKRSPCSAQNTSLRSQLSEGTIDPDTVYAATEFVQRCDADPLAVALATLRVTLKRQASVFGRGLERIRATGAEYIEAINAADCAVQSIQSRSTTPLIALPSTLDMSVQTPSPYKNVLP